MEREIDLRLAQSASKQNVDYEVTRRERLSIVGKPLVKKSID